ncbi:hypothetical protein [Ascidiimonas aurantiaca]|uniref:hypothetical protein n=1 Tax=Ascidiimonas aurantiaca TaxID=1685432 RepID=UPI0030EF9D01
MKNSCLLRFLLILFIFIVSPSCDDIIEVPDISDKTVILLAPREGAVIRSNTTTFSWEPVEDADNYLLQVATPDFETASQILVDSTLSRTVFTAELLPGNYEWRLKARNSGFDTSYSAFKFMVSETDGLSGNTLILRAPANNTDLNTEEVTLSWEPLRDATEYRVQVVGSGNEILFDQVTTDTEIELSFSEGRFTWRARAQNATESTLYSSRTITIDLTAPNIPVLNTPVDEATTTATTIDFAWTRDDIAGSTERDSIYIYTDETLQTLFLKARSNNKTFSTDLTVDTYYWNVKAFDAAGNESDVSNTFKFTKN